MQRDQIEVLDASDATFDKAKSQTLCLYLDLDLSEMDFFKVVVDGHLVDREEVEPSLINDLVQDDRATVNNSEARVRIKMNNSFIPFVL